MSAAFKGLVFGFFWLKCQAMRALFIKMHFVTFDKV